MGPGTHVQPNAAGCARLRHLLFQASRPSMPSGFKTETCSFARLLSEPRILQIPDYQRPYSWTTKEAGQLLDDLLIALDEASSEEPPETGYFLGTVLLMDTAALPKGVRPATASLQSADIVDGQQRLVTLTILLAVLRDLARDRGYSLDDRVEPLLWTREADAHLPVPRILLRGCEGEFLRDFVQKAGASANMPEEDDLTPGEMRILMVREHLAGELVTQTGEHLKLLADFLAEGCHFAVITTRTVDRAHRIFAVLNDRGRPLARNDILKAQILGGVAAGSRERHRVAWDDMEHRLGADFEELFSHIRTIEGRTRRRVISGIAELVDASGGAERFCGEVLEPYARIFEALRAPNALGSPAIRRTLTYLGWLGSADWMPAAMLYWRTCNGDTAKLENFLRRLDRLAYGLRLLGIGADKRLTRFHTVLAAIRQPAVLDAADGPLELTRDELRNINYNLRNLHARSQLTCKLVLLRLNDVMAGEPQGLDPVNYTVEHVLPQKPGRASQWRKWFPAADERETCTQSLGNLVLVTRAQNDRARNMELPRKLDVYFAEGRGGALHTTQELFGIEEWRGTQILEREQRLLALIQKLWSIDSGKGAGAASGRAGGPAPGVELSTRRLRHTVTE